jgi:hypothetical protein
MNPLLSSHKAKNHEKGDRQGNHTFDSAGILMIVVCLLLV